MGDLDNLVMETDGSLVRRVRPVFYPRFDIIQQMKNLGRNFLKRDSQVSLAPPKFAGPAPHVREHVLVQILDELSAKRVAAAARQRPILPARDILLLGVVQIVAVGDVSGNQIAHLVGRQRRRRVIRLIEDAAHRLFPKFAGIRFAYNLIDQGFGVVPLRLLILKRHGVLYR